MMNTMQIARLDIALERRRATKYFNEFIKIGDAELNQFLSAALSINHPFPTSPFKVVRVNCKTAREQLSEIGFKQPQFTQASEILIVCADAHIISAQTQSEKPSEQAVRDQSMFWCAVFSQGVQLAAAAYGYDSCPMIGFDFNRARELFAIPEHWHISNIVALGARAKAPLMRGSKLLYRDVVFEDRNKSDDSMNVM